MGLLDTNFMNSMDDAGKPQHVILHGRTRRQTKLLSIMTVLLMILIPLTVWALVTRTELAYDPFGEYPIQDIQLPEKEITDTNESSPEVKTKRLPWIIAEVGAGVPVEGTKCIISNEHVPVTGTVSWKMIEPVVIVIKTDSGSAIRNPGCTTSTFVNEIPQKVYDLHKKYSVDGTSIWQITGTETTEDGVSKVWVTENLALVDEEPA